jgi:hypothetical protein
MRVDLAILRTGLDLVMEFLNRQLWPEEGDRPPEYLKSNGWEVFSVAGPKYGGLTRFLSGYGLVFIFESFTPAECLLPAPEHLLFYYGCASLPEEALEDCPFLVDRLNLLLHAATLKIGEEGRITPDDLAVIDRWQKGALLPEDWKVVKTWPIRSGLGFDLSNATNRLKIIKRYLPEEYETLSKGYPPLNSFVKAVKNRNQPVIYLELDRYDKMLT